MKINNKTELTSTIIAIKKVLFDIYVELWNYSKSTRIDIGSIYANLCPKVLDNVHGQDRLLPSVQQRAYRCLYHIFCN